MRAVQMLLCAWLAGCGSDGDNADEAGALAMMPDVIGALPSFAAGPAMANAVGDPVADALILNRFKLECHGENVAMQNDCPAGVVLDLTTKYSGDTVLGLIAGAETNANEILQHATIGTCTVPGLTPRAGKVTKSSFVSTSTGGEGARYIVDELGALGCIADVSSTRHVAWAIPDATRRVSVTITKGAPLGSGGMQSFISQSVITLDAAGKPRAIALSDVNVTTMPPAYVGNSRAYVIANLATRRFLLKTSGGASVSGVIAAGQAGLSPAGIAGAGLFYAKTDSSTVCVDNETKKEASGCSVESAPWASGSTAASYLELTAEDAAAFAGYLAEFDDGPTGSHLTAAEVPAGTVDLIHFPDRIQ
jgi:hypothetical protein